MGNALFSSSATVHLTSNRSVVAVTYELEHSGIHLDHAVTVLEDYRYHSCFPPTDHHYVHLSRDLRQKLRRIERLPVVFNDRHRGYHCVRRVPTNAPHARKTTETNEAETVRTPPFVKTPIPSVRSNDSHPSVMTERSHPTRLPHPSPSTPSPATRPPLQKKNETHSPNTTHSITTGLFLSNETLVPNADIPPPASVSNASVANASVANASVANASVANASMVSETKGSLRSPLISVFRLTQSSSGHRIDGRDASSDHHHRILLVEGAQRVPVVDNVVKPSVERAQRVPVVEPEHRVPVKEEHEEHKEHEEEDDEDDE